MDPPKVDVDVEAQNQAQANDILETPEITTIEYIPPASNTTDLQPPSNAEPHPQATGLNDISTLKTPAPKTTYNSEVLHGISTFPIHNL